MTRKTGPRAAALTAALALVALPASAQQQQRQPAPATPAQAPAPTPEGGPERTSAQFGDWAVQCVATQQGRRICEMAQTVQDQARNQPVAVIAIGRLSREQPMKLAVRLPVNVAVAVPAQFSLEGGGEPMSMGFTRCSIVPVGCFAERDLRDDLLRRLRTRTAEQPGRITWRDANGAEATIPVTFRGFGAAYEALLKEGG